MNQGLYQRLVETIKPLQRVALAFSGGIDSSLLLAASLRALGPANVLALTVDSPLMTAHDRRNAELVAEQLGVAVCWMPFNELALEDVARNDAQRCYACKHARFSALRELAAAEGAVLIHGENTDDALDYRPGSRAAMELGVRAPLVEAGLKKASIRALAQSLNLPNWDAPAGACLATRFLTNTPLTAEGLLRVGHAEEALRGLLDKRQFRLRDHGDLARLEVTAAEVGWVASEPQRSQITVLLRELGYRYITLDLEGYRMGSSNEQV
ncbi:MAG: ATP-dependent sacrificial sulfur transferase LarE [Chloroflexi bacterium]|nr:ATP-dependent sacrificial sulfur transferase LarE [Chloroflexota bacterium]